MAQPRGKKSPVPIIGTDEWQRDWDRVSRMESSMTQEDLLLRRIDICRAMCSPEALRGNRMAAMLAMAMRWSIHETQVLDIHKQYCYSEEKAIAAAALVKLRVENHG